MTGTVIAGPYKDQEFYTLAFNAPSGDVGDRTLSISAEMLVNSYQTSSSGWRTVVLKDAGLRAVRDVPLKFLRFDSEK